MPHKRLLTAGLFLVLTLLTTGCIHRYPVVGAFDNHKDIFKGTVHHNSANGTAFIEVVAEPSGVTGQGNSWVTYVPFMSMGGGQKGRADLSFNDGRRVMAEWTTITLTSGYGTGLDQFGNTFHFTYGMSDAEATAYIDSQRRARTSLPELPPPYRPKETRKEKGFATGTGFFVSTEGHMITNFHVIEDCTEISIVTPDGVTHKAQILKQDPANDIALLKIPAKTTPLALTDSIEKGAAVLTIGFPMIAIQGQESKVTFGNVNALSGIQGDIRFTQIDVPVQPGNSGGPLINENGEVIGVVTETLPALITLRQTGTLPQNVNYAVKSDYVLPLIRGINTSQSSKAPARSRKEVIERSSSSVVLVIAK